MRRLKLFALPVLALLALAAASVPGASAAFKLEEKACEGTITAFCWESKAKPEGLLELVGEEEAIFTQEATPEPLFEALNNAGTKTEVHILCETGKGSVLVLQSEPLVKRATLEKGLITFEHCKLNLPEEPKCTIDQNLKAEFNGTELEKDILVKPPAKNFIEVDFKGAECLFKGKQPIKGEGECLWLPEALEKDAETQLCEFTHEDGGFFFGTEGFPASLLAEFEVLFPILEQDDLWDVGLG